MDSLRTQDLAQILGLYSPWQIKNIELSADSESLVISLDQQADKARFSFLNSAKKTQQVSRRWQHVRFGHFTTYVEANMTLEELSDITAERPPAFLGAENKSITRELADTIRIAYSRNLTAEMISGLLGIKLDVVEAEIREIETEEQQQQSVALLPLESNPIWRNILADKAKLSTRLLPLKLLLSRLKLDISKNSGDNAVMQKSVSELRNFFIRHANQLQHEYDQVGARATAAPDKTASTSKNKLVLPGTKNVIWHHLLTNEFDLDTRSMPLKLNLAQQRRSYATATNSNERFEIIRTLQLFFKHNARSHIPELKTLTQMVEQQKENVVELPPSNHDVWKQLLLDDQLLPTDKINYRLLISRLKTNYRRSQDQNSIDQLHLFFTQNSRTMTDEIKVINRIAAAQ